MMQPCHLLLVEDNPGDVTLVREALRNTGCETSVVPDGEAALAYVRREPPYENAILPNLILLDLNLPGKDGHAVLRELKAEPEFLSIPILILTNSDDEGDVRNAYDGHANGYLVKPADLDRFISTIRRLSEFWRNVAELPPREAARKQGA